MDLKKPETRGAVGPPADVPDGGYGWFIVLSCFTVFGLTLGVIKSFGVLYIEVQQHFNSTATAASLVTSITVATVHVASPLASAISARFSPRSVVMIGGLLCSVGVTTGSFARNLLELCLTMGFVNGLAVAYVVTQSFCVMGNEWILPLTMNFYEFTYSTTVKQYQSGIEQKGLGVGNALTWIPTMTMVGVYFDRRLPLANALSSAGECVLTLVLTPLSQWLIDIYSWRGAMLILGGLELNLCVCGALLRPMKTGKGLKHAKEVEAEEGQRMLQNDSPCLHQEDRGFFKSKILPYVDFTLIANADFMMYSMFGLFAALGFFAPALFLVPFARSRGVEEYQAAALMSINSILDLIGRVAFGWVANMRIIKTVHLLVVTVILLGVVLLLFPLASSYVELAACSAAFGLAFGGTVAIHITVLAEVVGAHRLGSALGFFMLIRSFGGLLGPPIAGFFIDRMGDYGAGFFMAGAALIISVIFLILLEVKSKRSSSNKRGEPKTKTASGHKAVEEAEVER